MTDVRTTALTGVSASLANGWPPAGENPSSANLPGESSTKRQPLPCSHLCTAKKEDERTMENSIHAWAVDESPLVAPMEHGARSNWLVLMLGRKTHIPKRAPSQPRDPARRRCSLRKP